MSGEPITVNNAEFESIIPTVSDHKIHPYKNPTFYKFFKKLYSNFSINESKLLRYADRRKKKMVFLKHLQRLKHVNS